jgi:hypothetical protein
VTLTCHDYMARLMEERMRSPLFLDQRVDQFLAQLVALLPADYQPAYLFDTGLFTLPYAWVDSEKVGREMQLLAETEGGCIRFRYDGTLLFENAVHLLGGEHQTVQATFAVSDWVDLQVGYNPLDYRNHVEVTYTPTREGQTQEIWKAQEIKRVRANSTTSMTAMFDRPVRNIVTPAADKDFVATTAGGIKKNSSVIIAITRYAQQAYIVIQNTGNVDLRMTWMSLRGRPILYGDEEKAEAADTSMAALRRGKRTHPIKDNLYIQDHDHAQALADYMLLRLQTPRMTVGIKNLDGMPWLEVFDRIEITEEAGDSLGEFFVGKIAWFYRRNGGFGMDIGAMPADLFGSSSFFTLGTDPLDGGKVYFF